MRNGNDTEPADVNTPTTALPAGTVVTVDACTNPTVEPDITPTTPAEFPNSDTDPPPQHLP